MHISGNRDLVAGDVQHIVAVASALRNPQNRSVERILGLSRLIMCGRFLSLN